MLQIAMEELETQGMSDAAQRIKDGYSILHFLNQRGAFWAGLNIGLEMHQL